MRPTVRGEHRLVTCVFADLAGSVERTRDLMPEAATKLVNSLLETMVEVLVKLGGTIDRFLGDGVLAVFGVPRTHEDDPERAVRAALQIGDRAAELGLGVTVGVNTGRVYFGPVGSSLHEELTVMGPVVNLAARLQGKAEPGQVVIGEATNAHVHAAFLTKPVAYDVKGIDEPVTAYLAERLLDRPEKVRGIRGLQAQLIGRDEELALLTALYGGGGVALVEGEAGVGKSRLAGEFRKQIEAQGGRWLEGRATELTQETAYAVLRDLFAREQATEASLIAEISNPIAQQRLGAGWLEEVGPFLTALVTNEPSTMVAAAGDQERRALTRKAVADYFAVTALAAPLVVAVDDIHWADSLSLELLSFLMNESTESSILYLLLSRVPANLTVEPADDRVAIRLSELSQSESRQLISSLLQIDGLPEELEESIVARAEGNPFYVEEIVRSFIQQGFVIREGDTWKAASTFANVEIPESVQAIVASRLDRLGEESRMTARYASVLDRTFPLDVLMLMTGAGGMQHLDTLVDAGLLYPEPGTPASHFSFWHALTREGVYDTLLPSQRLELHARAGEAYETVAPNEVEQLAYHYERSSDHAKAVVYLTAASRHARDSYLNKAALDYADRGLERAHEMGGNSTGLRAELHGLRGEILERLARHAEAQAELRTAIETGLPSPLHEGRLTTTLAMSLRLSHKYELAYELYDRAESILTAAPLAHTSEYKHALIELGRERSFAFYFDDRRQELATHNVQLGKLIQEHGTAAHKMDHLVGLALAEYQDFNFLLADDTVTRLEPVLDLARSSGNPDRLAEAHFALGFAKLWADQHDAAVPLLEEGVRLCERVGEMTTLMRATAYHAIALRRVGRVDDAATAAERALAEAEAGGSGYYCGHALATSAWVAWKRGGTDDALAFIERAVSAWGLHDLEANERGDLPADFRSLGTEFAWMVVWPAVACDQAAGRWDSIPGHLQYLRSPWERPMYADLKAATETAGSDPSPENVSAALALAERYRLL